MILEFMLTSEVVKKEIGAKLHGITINQRRPVAVGLTRSEIKYLIENPEYLNTIHAVLQELP